MHLCMHRKKRPVHIQNSYSKSVTDSRLKGQTEARAAASPFISSFGSWFSVLEEAQMSQAGFIHADEIT